jgi:hypothetical protein
MSAAHHPGLAFTVGFTGTRKGMTKAQEEKVIATLKSLQPGYFRFGMAVGADWEAYLLVREHVPGCAIIAHPCNISNQQAKSITPDIMLPEDEPLKRNREIVLKSDVLIVCPAEKNEMLRSGTWSTYRFAQKQGKKIILCNP